MVNRIERAFSSLNSKISYKVMTYAKVVGLANTKTVKISGLNVGSLYGSILVFTNQNCMDYIMVSGKDSIDIQHLGNNKNTTCVYDESQGILTITFSSPYSHGVAVVGGTIATANTNIVISQNS